MNSELPTHCLGAIPLSLEVEEGATTLGEKADCCVASRQSHSNITSLNALYSHAGIETLANISSYLHPLDKTTVFNLGLVLGLDYNRLKTMMDSPSFLEDMLAGWLQQMDQVLSTGVPTWKRLVEALKDQTVGQNGLASKIEEKQLR